MIGRTRQEGVVVRSGGSGDGAGGDGAGGEGVTSGTARVGARLRELRLGGGLDLPLPGGGATWPRWQALADIAEEDLSLAKLAEAHVDAVAILAELGEAPPGADDVWAVWAAEPPGTTLAADRAGGRWLLSGTKPFCSGAGVVSHALVTAPYGEERRLFALDLSSPGIGVHTGGWATPAMAAAGTATLELDRVPAVPVGGARAYLDRPGFWHGGIGVAACWYGGARGVARPLRERGRRDDLTLAQLGAVDVALAGARAALRLAADEVDADPGDAAGTAELRTQRVRAVVEHAVEVVVRHVGRALGPAPLAFDGGHAQRVADLQLYVRQHHAERDLARLGLLVAETQPGW